MKLPSEQDIKKYLHDKHETYFVALDGEAINEQYVLLGSSEDVSIYNEKGLSVDEILSFIFELETNLEKKTSSKRVYLFFAGHYDVNMFFRQFPDEANDRIFGDGSLSTHYGDYCIRYTPKKHLTVSRTHPTNKRKRQQVKIFDCFSFFNTSFISATKNFYGEVPEIIKWGKKLRVSFDANDVDAIRRYNNEECKILVDMMQKMAGWLDDLGIKTKSWYGPSALANVALNEMRIREEQKFYSPQSTPELLWEAIIHSFFGGRIEAFNLGTIPKIYNYDINSAYPAAMRFLVAITAAEQWVYTEKFNPKEIFAIYHVQWDVGDKERICPFPWRTKSGLIMFPPMGEGWYWAPEVKAAIEKYGAEKIRVSEGFIAYAPPSRVRGAVEFIYAERQRLKAEGNPAEYILKIMLNSFFGKFGQSIGHPQFQCLPWAGFITSYTRAKLMAAIAGIEKHIVAFATDGIFSRVQIPSLPLSHNLGDWSYSEFDKITVLMSGVYRKYRGNESDCICRDEELALSGYRCTVHSDATRGFKSASNLWETLLDQLNIWAKKPKPGNIPEIITRQFITYKMGRNYTHENRESKMYRFVEYPKKIDPKQSDKRNYFLREIRNWRTDNCDSEPEYIPGGEKARMSYPYVLKSAPEPARWSDQEVELMWTEEGEILPL